MNARYFCKTEVNYFKEFYLYQSHCEKLVTVTPARFVHRDNMEVDVVNFFKDPREILPDDAA